MNNKTTIKNGKWVWPIADEKSWEGQNQHLDLVNHVLPYVKNKNIMIQAGGNCGLILSTFVDHFNYVYTFEPDPINFYCLSQNVTQENVFKLQACLSDSNKTVQVQQLERPNMPHDTGGVHVSGDGHLPSISIDSLNLPGCDLLQLDVEGFELKALRGAINTIKKYKPVLCIELCEKWLNRYNDSSADVVKFVESLGYKQVDAEGVDCIFVHE